MKKRMTTICFEVEEDQLLAIFEERRLLKGLENFMKDYFSSYIEMHVRIIKNNLKMLGREMEEEQIQQIAFERLKSSIKEEEMRMLKIAVVKDFVKQCVIRESLIMAINKAFEGKEVSEVAESIQKKLRYEFLVAV